MYKKLFSLFIVFMSLGGVVISIVSLLFSWQILFNQEKEVIDYDRIMQPYIEEINKSISNITVRLDSLEDCMNKDKEIYQKSLDSIKTDVQLNKNMIQVMRRSSQIMFP